MSIAELGLSIDSSQAAPAAAALDKLTAAAKTAEGAASKLGPAAAVAGAALGATEKATTSAANAHAGYSTQAMAAFHATRSLAEGLAYGMSPTQALAMQLNHLSYAASGPGGLTGAFKEVGSMLAGMLTPMRLLGIAGVATGVALYAANAIWKASALELDNVARAAGLTVTQLRALQTNAAGKGIDNFAESAGKFASNIYDARNGLGSLAEMLSVNGERATDFVGTLKSVSSIIQRARSDQQALQLLQQAGLPATMEWVRLLQQGPDAIQRTIDNSRQLSDREQELIDKAREFDERWNTNWANIKSGSIDAFIHAKAGLNDFIELLDRLNVNKLQLLAAIMTGNFGLLAGVLGDVAGTALKTGGSVFSTGSTRDVSVPSGDISIQPRGNAAKGPAIDINVVRATIQAQQAYFSILGQTLTVDQQIAQIETQIRAYRLDPKAIKLTQDQIDNLKRLARERALGIDQIKASRDAYDVETASVGMSVGQAAAYAAVQNKINEYKRNGHPLSMERIDDLTREAQAMGAAAQRADDMKFGFDTFSSTMRDFGTNLRQGQTAWQAFENAGVSALGKIADRLMDMASRNLWNAAFPSSGGGLFSFFGNLFGGGSSFNLGRIGQNAQGTDNWRGGPTWVGENGPEIVNLPRGAQVVPNNKVAAMMNAGGNPIQVTVAPVYTFNNADPTVEARLTQQIQQSANDTQQKTIAAVAKLRQNSPGNYLPPMK